MQKNGLGISFKYFTFVETYIETGKITATCKKLGISRTTAYEWLKEKEVIEYLQTRQNEMKNEAKQIYFNTYMDCFSRLKKIITSDSYNIETAERLKAIDIFLRHYEKMQSIEANIKDND